MTMMTKGLRIKPGRHSHQHHAIIVDPVPLYRDSLTAFIQDCFGGAVHILGEVKSLSEAREMQLLVKSDVVIGAPYGVNEDLHDWEHFCRLSDWYYPHLRYLVWSSIPRSFIREFTPDSFLKRVGILSMRTSREDFYQVLSRLLSDEGAGGASINDAISCSYPCRFNMLTQSEIVVLSELFQGKSPFKIALKCRKSVKTISAHKRNAMKKLGVVSDKQLIFMMRHSRFPGQI